MSIGIASPLPSTARRYEVKAVYRNNRTYFRCESDVDVDICNDGGVRKFKTRERAQKRCDELNQREKGPNHG
ncbi:hypothetical protein ACM9XA_03670 [Xanthomonas sacchari]